MKFSTVDTDLSSVLTTGYYKIPRFQRPYSWTPDELEDFWTDAVIEGVPGYFVGSIVLHKEGQSIFKVVDGQQRLTTVTMLLSALRDEFHSAGLKKQADGLHALIERPDIDSLPQYVLQPETSYPYFQEHIQKRGEPEVDATPGEEEEVLSRAFEYLRKKVSDAVESIRRDSTIAEREKSSAIKAKLTDVRDRVLGLTLILVELENEDDAYVAFETLNARGKDLRPTDLVKNHLARYLTKKSKTVDLFRDKWNTILETIEGSTAKITVDNFLHHYWLSKYEYVSLKKLFRAVKKKIKRDDAQEFLEALATEAKIYRSVFDPDARSWDKKERDIAESLRAFNIFQVRQATPLILATLAQYAAGNLKPKHVEDILAAIESFHYQFTAVASQSSSGGISAMYASHARSVRDAENLEDRVRSLRDLAAKLRGRLPSRDEFEAGFSSLRYSDLYTRDRDLVRYTLGRLSREGLNSPNFNFWNLSIEHLAAQSLTDVSAEAVASIGNLILVDKDLNNKLSNRPFKTKKRALQQSAEVWMDGILQAATDWGEDQIGVRTKALAALAVKKVWRI